MARRADAVSFRTVHTNAFLWLRRTHLAVGLLAIVVFIGTGQYMDRVHDHLHGMPDVRRMLFRSAHIYLLLSGLLNLALGLYLAGSSRPVGRLLQAIGSVFVLAGPALLLLAFVYEPWLTDLERPFARPALYGALAGMLLHLAGHRPSASARADGARGDRRLEHAGS